MTLPAHRFHDREPEPLPEPEDRKKKKKKQRVWPFDYDETITKAPKQCRRIAEGLKKLGDTIVVVTGNQSPRDELKEQLDAYKFPYDDLIQYQDDQTDGLNRAAILKQLNAWGAFDDRAGRGPTLADVCPHFFLVANPPKRAKKREAPPRVAKKATKGVRSEERSAAPPPPNLRPSDSDEGAQPEHECGTCVMWDNGVCWGYGNIPTDGEWACDSWALDPNWQQQDAAQDADDDVS